MSPSTRPFGAANSATTTHAFGRPALQIPQASSKLYASDDSDKDDDEIEKLKAMAAKLRAEAASLESEKADELAKAAEKAFRKFDLNQDGEISVEELKLGLEKVLKTELSERRVQELLKEFDTNKDGALQIDEFVTVDKFRNRLEALAREEKALAQELAAEAKREREAAALLEARLSIINDDPPSLTDRAVSVLPYLFPLLDGLQFGRFLLQDDGNPAVTAVALLFALYRSVPFSGFIVFFALSFLSNNPSINRLIRFNMQQAIYLDIALFFPGLITSLLALVFGGAGIPASVSELGTDAIFVTLLVTLAYCSISSILGFTPDKLPVISNAASDRMPTIDMFDAEGRFVPREMRENKDKEDDKKNDK